MRWDVFESGLAREAARLEDEARGARAALLGDFVERAVASYLETAQALVREIAASA